MQYVWHRFSLDIQSRREVYRHCSFRGKSQSPVSTIGEWVRNAPAHIGLLHISYRLIFQRMCFMKKETSFEVNKLIVFSTFIGQCSSAFFYILFTTAIPSTLCRGKNVCINVILADDVSIRTCLCIVPRSRYCSCNFGSALTFVINIALVNAHQVSIHIKVVGVVIAAINIGKLFYDFTRRGPHLCQITDRCSRRSCNQTIPAYSGGYPFSISGDIRSVPS